MDFSECPHINVSGGVCEDCFEEVCLFFQEDTNESSKKKISRKMRTITETFISRVIEKIRNSIPIEIMNKVSEDIHDGNIQIRDEETAMRTVFAYIYSALYSRKNIPLEKLFELTPDRLMVLICLKKNDVTKSLNLINSSKIQGPSFVMINPYLYLIEFRANNPNSVISRLITDKLIKRVKDAIDPEIHLVASQNPAKTAISYMGIVSEKILKPERGSVRPIKDMYDFYNFKLSQVKDTLPIIRDFFAKDFEDIEFLKHLCS